MAKKTYDYKINVFYFHLFLIDNTGKLGQTGVNFSCSKKLKTDKEIYKQAVSDLKLQNKVFFYVKNKERVYCSGKECLEHEINKRRENIFRTPGINYNTKILAYGFGINQWLNSPKFLTDNQIRKALLKYDSNLRSAKSKDGGVTGKSGNEWIEINPKFIFLNPNVEIKNYYISALKNFCEINGLYFIANEEGFDVNPEIYKLRKKQEEGYNKISNYYFTNFNNTLNTLMFLLKCYTRFGKTFTTLYSINEITAKRNLQFFRICLTSFVLEGLNEFINCVRHIKWYFKTPEIIYSSGVFTDDTKIREEEIKNKIKFCEENKIPYIFVSSIQNISGMERFKKFSFLDKTEFDFLIIDEAHKATKYCNSENYISSLKTYFKIYISATPYKIQSDFTFENTYEYSYTDARMFDPQYTPKMNFLNYKMSDEVSEYCESNFITEDNVKLVDFFTENNSNDVSSFCNFIFTKYFLSSEELRKQNKISILFFNEIKNAEIFEQCLKSTDYYEKYNVHVVNIAGEHFEKGDESVTDFVNTEIEKHPDSIIMILSCGRCGEASTIEKLTTVVHLWDGKSPQKYCQLSGRGNTYYVVFDENENVVWKKTDSYIYDFSANRSLEWIGDIMTGNASKIHTDEEVDSPEYRKNLYLQLDQFNFLGVDNNGCVEKYPTEVVFNQVVKLTKKNINNLAIANGLNKIRYPFDYFCEIKTNKKDNTDNCSTLSKILSRTNFEGKSLRKDNNKKIIIPISKNVGEKTKNTDTNSNNTSQIVIKKKYINEGNYINLIISRIAIIMFYCYSLDEDNVFKSYTIKEVINNFSPEFIHEYLDVDNSILRLFDNDTDEYKRQHIALLEKYNFKDEMYVSHIRKFKNLIRNYSLKYPKDLLAYIEAFISDTSIIASTKETVLTKNNVCEKILCDVFLGEYKADYSKLAVYTNENIEEYVQDCDKYLNTLLDDFIHSEIVNKIVTALRVKYGNNLYTNNFDNNEFFNIILSYVRTVLSLGSKEVHYDIQSFMKNMYIIMAVDAVLLGYKTGESYRNYLKTIDYSLYIKSIIEKLRDSGKVFIFSKGNIGKVLTIKVFKNIFDVDISKCIINIDDNCNKEIINNLTPDVNVNSFNTHYDYMVYLIRYININDADLISNQYKKLLATYVKRIFNLNYDNKLMKGGDESLKFDICIGNPPYNGIYNGKKTTLYDKFTKIARHVSIKSSFITPGRGLINAESSDKKQSPLLEYCREFINDKHSCIKNFYPISSEIFPNTSIRGGIIQTYSDETQIFDASTRNINTFRGMIFYENRMNTYFKNNSNVKQLSIYVCPSGRYKWTKNTVKKYPDLMSEVIDSSKIIISEKLLTDLGYFSEEKRDNTYRLHYINKHLSGKENRNISVYVNKELIKNNPDTNNYRLALSYLYDYDIANPLTIKNSTVANNIFILEPDDIVSQSFTVIDANIHTKKEIENLFKYLHVTSTCLAVRANVLTVHVHKNSFNLVPIEDFSENSDVPWDKSIVEISRYLFHKYGFTDEEIAEIEKGYQF